MGSVGAAKRTGSTDEETLRYILGETEDVPSEDLQKFRGRAINDGWEFEGNEWTVNWFSEHSNADELVAGMDAPTVEAFHAYTAGDFMHGEMYRDPDSLFADDRRNLRNIVKTLDNATLDTGIVVYRRSTFELINAGSDRHLSVEQINKRVGEIIPCKGCLSTSAAREGLEGMGWKPKPVEYEIEIPAGKGSGMWVGDRKVNPGWGPRQREYLTNADANYEIRGAREDKKRGVTVVTLRYVGHGKHRW